MAIIGIDLGTTYSCVAIPEARGGEGFYSIPDCPGYTILQDKFKRMTTPSVVAENRQGQVVVGHTAKAMAGFRPEPIMFAKRSMGEDVTFVLDKLGTLRPEEVSAHILRHLKAMAEERLGEPVTEAVITVPAYFTMKAKQLTEQAGELAGLRVVQVAQEPVAAAMMYCANDSRDPLRILTYDLGGGTFDVAILEKRDGVISSDSVLAFDGDRFLGGYNLDRKLALWLIERLCAKGYDLDPNEPVAFAKLLVIAERVKVKLSHEDYVEIRDEHSDITDRQGNPVVIEEDITRTQFEEMIAPEIERTIDICRRALEEKGKSPIARETIDEIVMVGGSSRIPLVAHRLLAEFGREPKLVNPDLCVALGAAILAGTQAQVVGRLRLDPIPEVTDLEMLTITGRVLPEGTEAAVAGLAVTVNSDDGAVARRTATDSQGGFALDRIPLTPEATTPFILRVVTAAGAAVATHRFSVRQTEQEQRGGLVEAVTNILAKPLSLLLYDGPCEVAPERTPLPFTQRIGARTMDSSGEIRIVILEENAPLGEIVMSDLPKTLDIGTPVEVTLEVQANYQIVGRAFIRALDREARVVIDLPIPKRKSREELRNELVRLEGLAEDVKGSANPGVLFAKGARLDKRLGEAKKMLEDSNPDLLMIQDCLNEIEGLIREIGAGWRPQPPRASFQQKLATIDGRLAALLKKRPELKADGYEHQLEAIRKEADKAYGEQNSAAWQEANRNLENLAKGLMRLEGGEGTGGGSQPPPDPALLVVQLGQGLSALEQEAKNTGRYEALKGDFADCAAALKAIDPKAPDAMSRIADLYNTRYKPLEEKVHGVAPPPGTPGKEGGLVGLEKIDQEKR